jgi:hypothetical protein
LADRVRRIALDADAQSNWMAKREKRTTRTSERDPYPGFKML